MDEETGAVATGAEDEVLVVGITIGVEEALVEKVVGAMTGAIEVVGTKIAVVEDFWLCVAEVSWMKRAALEEDEAEAEVAEEVVAGALTAELEGVTAGIKVEDDWVNSTGVPSTVEVPRATALPVW